MLENVQKVHHLSHVLYYKVDSVARQHKGHAFPGVEHGLLRRQLLTLLPHNVVLLEIGLRLEGRVGCLVPLPGIAVLVGRDAPPPRLLPGVGGLLLENERPLEAHRPHHLLALLREGA